MMASFRISDLTERELEVIRLVARNRGSDEIARMLDISTATVQTHIKRARAKAGGISRYALANAVAEWDGRPQSIATPELGIAPVSQNLPSALVPINGTQRLGEEALHEERAIFGFEDPHSSFQPQEQKGSINDLTASQRLGRIGIIAFQIIAGLATLLVAMTTLQRLILGR
ncbi:response regulator transcription factor [Sphingomonas sp. PAMC 26617]|uniref:response regulator transcription factor n=1 Tax=Sphingomonas sp. PAMC 26617 TaxID=1112216 RepID=UPI0002887DB7|nr:helix-turn-helix transcriptional regulator [Sphingomonas sp. PAMC 26617]